VQLNSHEILQRFNRMRDEIDPVLQRRWGDNHDDAGKRSISLNEQVIERFGTYAIGGIGFEAGSDMPSFGQGPDGTPAALRNDDAFNRHFVAKVNEFLPGVWEYLKASKLLPEETRFELIKDDLIYGGQIVTATINGRKIRVSLHSVRVAPRAVGLRQTLGRWPSKLLEIGGGHGRFIRDVATCSPETKLFYCDLPFNMALAASYLGRKFPEQVNLVWSAEDRVDPEKKINIIAPWRLMDLPEGVEVCCNFLSFQHMSHENLTYYAEILNARGVGAVYHQNRTLKLRPGEIDMTDYPLHRWYRIASEMVLGNAYLTTQGRLPVEGARTDIGTFTGQYLRRIET
jgi:putative sugar O-methyltransferase